MTPPNRPRRLYAVRRTHLSLPVAPPPSFRPWAAPGWSLAGPTQIASTQVRGQIVMGVMVGRPHFDQGEDIDTVLAATERWKGAPPPWMKDKFKAPAVSVR